MTSEEAALNEIVPKSELDIGQTANPVEKTLNVKNDKSKRVRVGVVTDE